MITVGKDTRLTDELERQLMAQAIEEQFRFKPLEALKKLFAKLSVPASHGQAPAAKVVESAA